MAPELDVAGLLAAAAMSKKVTDALLQKSPLEAAQEAERAFPGNSFNLDGHDIERIERAKAGSKSLEDVAKKLIQNP